MRSGAIPAGEPARVLSGVPLFAGLDRVDSRQAGRPTSSASGSSPARSSSTRAIPATPSTWCSTGPSATTSRSSEAGRRPSASRRWAPGHDVRRHRARSRTGPARPPCEPRRRARRSRLERGRFLGLVAQEPAVALAIAATLSERVWRANVRGVRTVETRDARADRRRRSPCRGRRRRGAQWRRGIAPRPAWPGRARPRDPRRDVADAARGSARRRAGARSARSAPWCRCSPSRRLPEAFLALAGDRRLDARRRRARRGWASPGFATPSWVLVVAVLCFGRRAGLDGSASTGSRSRSSDGRAGGFAGQAAALALAGVALGRRCPNATGRVGLRSRRLSPS